MLLSLSQCRQSLWVNFFKQVILLMLLPCSGLFSYNHWKTGSSKDFLNTARPKSRQLLDYFGLTQSWVISSKSIWIFLITCWHPKSPNGWTLGHFLHKLGLVWFCLSIPCQHWSLSFYKSPAYFKPKFEGDQNLMDQFISTGFPKRWL